LCRLVGNSHKRACRSALEGIPLGWVRRAHLGCRRFLPAFRWPNLRRRAFRIRSLPGASVIVRDRGREHNSGQGNRSDDGVSCRVNDHNSGRLLVLSENKLSVGRNPADRLAARLSSRIVDTGLLTLSTRAAPISTFWPTHEFSTKSGSPVPTAIMMLGRNLRASKRP
jgi:hypothetical protein